MRLTNGVMPMQPGPASLDGSPKDVLTDKRMRVASPDPICTHDLGQSIWIWTWTWTWTGTWINVG